MRHRAQRELLALLRDIATRRRVEMETRIYQEIPATALDARITAAVREAIAACGCDVLELSSGAGHDAMMMAKLCPSGMIFLRCKDGISHNPAESITVEDADVGVRVLLETVRRVDQRLQGARAEMAPVTQAKIARLVEARFEEEVAFLRELVRVPTDTPPGDNAPHARAHRRAAGGHGLHGRALSGAGQAGARGRPCLAHQPDRAAALRSRSDDRAQRPRRRGAAGRGLDASRPTRASSTRGACTAAASPSPSPTSPPTPSRSGRSRRWGGRCAGTVELHFTYDEEFGGLLGPGYLLRTGATKPDLAIGAGFSYAVVTAHNGCLQLEVTVHGKSAHAAMPETGHDALQAAVRILNALYAERETYAGVKSRVAGIDSPTLTVGRIEGGINTNVVPDRVALRLDRRMIPEEDPRKVEQRLKAVIRGAVKGLPGIERGGAPAPARQRADPAARPRAPGRGARGRAPPPCSASPSRPPRRRSTRTRASTPKPACPSCSTAPARAPSSRPTPSAPTRTSCSTISNAQRSWWPGCCRDLLAV